MKTKLNLRRGTFGWTRQSGLNYGEGWALANGMFPERHYRGFKKQSQFCFSFGAYGWTKVRVWADHLEDAFEIAVEWLDDNAPGHLVDLTQDDYNEAAKELGLDPASEDEDIQNEIRETAEADLTHIGHTTLNHGQFLTSYEWTVNEITR